MKQIKMLGWGLAIVALFVSCTQPKPVNTIDSLTKAYNGESNASAKYAAFAQKAKQEGFDTIAVLFRAASRAEGIHAENHKKVLEKLGVTIDAAVINEFTNGITKDNLEEAIKGETYEVDSMYPAFLKFAAEEKVADAIKSFTWAFDTEKKHTAFYKKALAALVVGNESTLPAMYAVCPKCGNTFNDGSIEESCSFCMTPKEKFIEFKLTD